jgi:predicted ester cyclase
MPLVEEKIMDTAAGSWSGRKLVIGAMLVLLLGGLLVYSVTRPENIAARMSAEDARIASFQRYYDEAWSQGNMAMLGEVLTADTVRHEAGTDRVGIDATASLIASFRTAIPDLRFDIRDMTVDGDRLWAYLVGSGVQTGPFTLADGTSVPATDAPVSIEAIVINRFVDGRIAETWVEYDNWLQQTGVVPSAQKVATEAQNMETAHRVIDDLWNAGNLNSANDLYHMPFTWHKPNLGYSVPVTLWTWENNFHDLHTAMPDLVVTVNNMSATRDRVIVHYSFQGTHEGIFYSPTTILPTGEVVTWDGIFIYRFEDGKIAEEWWYWDNEYVTRAEYGLSN